MPASCCNNKNNITDCRKNPSHQNYTNLMNGCFTVFKDSLEDSKSTIGIVTGSIISVMVSWYITHWDKKQFVSIKFPWNQTSPKKGELSKKMFQKWKTFQKNVTFAPVCINTVQSWYFRYSSSIYNIFSLVIHSFILFLFQFVTLILLFGFGLCLIPPGAYEQV